MKVASLLTVAVCLGACATHSPPLATPSIENPQRIKSSEWVTLGANSAYAHPRAVGDGIVAAWVRTDVPVRRNQRTGEPNRAPVSRQLFAWTEVDCAGRRYRESHHREYADAQLVPVDARLRSIGWERLYLTTTRQYYLCEAVAERAGAATGGRSSS